MATGKSCSRWFAPVLALLMVVGLSGCFDKEGDQRKAFIDFLQNTAMRSGERLPTLTADQQKQFGPFVSDYAIPYGYSLQVNQAIDFNISLAALKHIRRGVFLDLKKEKAVNQKLIKKLQVKCESMKQKVTNLSGGNQQKVVIAKWFASKARIIVLDEPTRGIDIGAKVEVYKLINEMVEAGIGVILLSSEVPEVFGMADRILVLKDGQITGEYGMDEINKINETDLQRLVM